MRARRLSLAALVAVSTVWGATALSPARANARLETEEQRVSRVLQDTLVAHGGEVNRCFEKALADSLDVAGKIELAVDVGDDGHVTKTAPALDEAQSPVLLACLQASAATWSFAGIDPGSTVIVPLSFDSQPAQFSIRAADAPDHGPAVAAKPAKGKRTGPSAGPLFSVKLLVDEKTMRARQASLSMLTVSPASRIAMHKHPGAEILYVLKGHARILSQPGTPPEKLDEGMAIYIPAGAPHAIENMGRQSSAVMLDYFVPMGPERVYRDPTDVAGRAAFEVLHDVPAAPAPPVGFVVVNAAKVAPLTIAGGKAHVRKLFTRENTGKEAAYLGVLEAEPGLTIPVHSHTSAEILYVVSGGGVVDIGAEPVRLEPDVAVHIPEGQPHLLQFSGPDKTVMIQLYAPAGPEQRYIDEGPAPKGKP
ncbi:MAG TPA: cupin domain-containing protein [Polyangia bacterium]|nr:cupin domain-containing protein [Polyangia bacterium]